MNPCVWQVYHFQLTRRVQNLDVPSDFGRGQVKVFQAIGVFKDFDISCAKNGHGSRDGWLWDEQVLKYTRNHLSSFFGLNGPLYSCSAYATVYANLILLNWFLVQKTHPMFSICLC